MAEAAKKRKGTALLAVMNENCTSCAGSPLCEVHCPVDDCINLLYEEVPGGGASSPTGCGWTTRSASVARCATATT